MSLTSADKLVILTEVLTSVNEMAFGNLSRLPNVTEILENLSPEGVETLGSYDGDIEDILEEAIRGPYGVDDLNQALAHLLSEVDDVDGDFNTISTAMLPYIASVNGLTSTEVIDHEALFQEILKVGAFADVSNRSEGDQGALGVSEFRGGLQAMTLVAMNIAQENGVDVQTAMAKFQEAQKGGLSSTFENADGEVKPEDPSNSDCTVEENPMPGYDSTIICKF